MSYNANLPCPCGSGKKYKKCCRVYHNGEICNTSLLLMKSRFSAFAVGDIDYIIKTSTFQNDYDDLKSFSDSCIFEKLTILDYTESTVTFRATVTCDGVDNSFTEKSKFIKTDGRWYYESGDII